MGDLKPRYLVAAPHRRYDGYMRPLIIIPCIFICAACGDDSPIPDGQTTSDLFPAVDYQVSKPCNSSNCSTCCIETVCVKLVTRTACGLEGNPCEKCKPGEDCKNGECLNVECTQTNCPDGCCDPELGCQKGTKKEACGRGAITCNECAGDDLCINGKCAPRGSDVYKIILKSAIIVEGADCGPVESMCDPMVELFIGDATDPIGPSDFQQDNHSPVWNEEMVTSPAADILKQFKIKVWDDDNVVGNDLISECTWKITEDDLASGSIVNHCGTHVQDLTFEFQPQ